MLAKNFQVCVLNFTISSLVSEEPIATLRRSKRSHLKNYIFSLPVSQVLSEYLNVYLLCEDPPQTEDAPKSPQGTVENPFSFPFSKVKETQLEGGTVKVVDSTTFKISKTIAAAEVTVEPGAMR